MIVRVLTAPVPSGDAPVAIVVLRQTLAQMQGQPGLEYAKLARRLVEGPRRMRPLRRRCDAADRLAAIPVA